MARTSLHTPKYIHRGWCRRHFKSPPSAFFLLLLFSLFFLFEVRARRVIGGKGSFAISEDLSSVLYFVARVCPCVRGICFHTRFVIVVILCLFKSACVPTRGGEIYRESGHKERD